MRILCLRRTSYCDLWNHPSLIIEIINGLRHSKDKEVMRHVKLLVVCLALGALGLAGEAEILVRDISVQTLPELTRVEVFLSGRVEYKAGRIPSPDRLYFDLQQAYITLRFQKSRPVNDGRIKTIRVGQNNPETVRVVLDMEKIERYTTYFLDGPVRLVIDIFVESAERPPEGAPEEEAQISELEAAGQPLLKNIQFESNKDFTRVSVELSRKVKFTKARISPPDSLYYYFENTLIHPRIPKSLPVSDGIVKEILVHRLQPDIVIVSLVLDAMDRYNTRFFENPIRLVIDVYKKK